MKKLLVALSVMLCMVSCKSFKVNVELENSTGKTVYLQRYEGTDLKTLDSVVAKDNTAVFKVRQNKNLDAYCLMIKGWRRPITFFADNQDVTIVGDYQKVNAIEIQASESQNKLTDFMKMANDIEDDKDLYYFVLDFIKTNLDNPISPYVAYRYKWLFEQGDLETIYEVLPENMQCAYKVMLADYIDGLKLTSSGNPCLDFTQKDVNGNDFTLSSVVGQSKIIILDFWASWCPDCRKENPQLVALYNEFKDKGLDIVSVSLDADEAAWKKAIADDNLSWPHHVSDLKGWGNSVAEMYRIAFIPQNCIIDENGIIFERNVPLEKIENLLLSVLN